MTKGEPWYVHFIMYAIIVVLIFVLLKVAYFDPNEVLEKEKYFKKESRIRMSNLRAAEKLWQVKFGKFTDNLDSLIQFVKTDPSVKKVMEGIDTVTHKSTNPFLMLSNGMFEPDSFFMSPKSLARFTLLVDTTESADTIIDRRGRIIKVDRNIVIGTKYFISCPDGYGTIGDLRSDAMKNTASWE